MKIVLFITGFISLVIQIILLRELNCAFYGIELIYPIALGIWLLGSACGVFFIKKTHTPAKRFLILLIIICSLFLPADIIFIRSIRFLSGEARGAFLPFSNQLLFLFLSLIPLSFASGYLFRQSAALFLLGKKTLPKAYFWESLGSFTGGALTTLLIITGVSNFNISLTCAIVVLLCLFIVSGKDIVILSVLISASILVLAGYFFSQRIDILTAQLNNPNIISVRDTPYSRATISYYDGQYTLYEDDVVSYESQSVSAEEFCQLSLIMHNNPKNILLLGGGYRGTLKEILKLKIKSVHYVEYNRQLLNALSVLPPDIYKNDITDKRVKVIFSDPVDFLNKAAIYDAILIDMPEPTSGQTNRFYTREFFRLCKAHLTGQGIIAFKIKSEENFWPPLLVKRNASICNALKSQFKYITVLPGTINIFTASTAEFSTNPDTLAQRFIKRNITTQLVSPMYIKYLLNNDRYFQIKKLLAQDSVTTNTDKKPACYQYSMLLWLSKFYPAISTYKASVPSTNIFIIFFMILAVIFLAVKKSIKAKQYILMFVISFQVMALEVVLILYYQIKNGVLYQNIGLLLIAFMAGLCMGSYYIDNLQKKLISNPVYKRKAISILLLLFLVLNTAVFVVLNYEVFTDLFSVSVLLVITAFLQASLFSVLSLKRNSNPLAVISPLYSSDLMGACLSSVLTGLVLIPILGLTGLLFSGSVVILLSFILV